MSKVVIFGIGHYADTAYIYLTRDSSHQIVGFTADARFLTSTEKHGLPVVPFESVQSRFPPSDFEMFVAIGYQSLNRLRSQKYREALAKGYRLTSYVSSRSCNLGGVPVGDNCFILDLTVIQPAARFGNDVFVWNALIGHDAVLGDHSYIAGNAVISGGTTIGSHCFIGVGATIGHAITIGDWSFIGAGAVLTKSVPAHSVHIVPDTPRYRLDSAAFLRLTKMPGG